MKMLTMLNLKSLLSTLSFLMVSQVSGQDTISHLTIYPAGISFEYGTGNYSVKDEFISNEKYSGKLPYFSVGWARNHNKYVYQLEMEYRNSDEIKNYNVSTTITQFKINQGFLYSMKKRELFKKDLNFWLGPSTELYFFNNKQNIAVDGFDYSQSFAALFSAGINIFGTYSINPKFLIESSLDLPVLSLGFRSIDSEEDDQTPAKLLTLFSGLNSSFDLRIRYYIFDKLSIKAGYKFELCRISAWYHLISSSDNLLLGIIYNF
ncbi:MAG: hypothetical protein JXC36_04930 [Candidatus Atribacteria bacterium]|nr:hypothetical protein [Candidatus Atribacteria bacterium]